MSLPRLLRNGLRYWRAFGTRALVRELQRRLTTPLPPGMTVAHLPPPEPAAGRNAPPQPAQALLNARFSQAAPMTVFTVPRDGAPRISIVTDSINKGSLFGGVGTAMLLAALLVRQRGARLRIITRTEPAQGANLQAVLSLYGITIEGEVEFSFAHVNAPQSSVNVYPDELFITTSWWTTASTLAAIAPQRILYVLQEDERMFYPGGDDQLRAEQVLGHAGVHVAVNTHGLLQHLLATGLPQLQGRAVAFEPAFPASVYAPQARPAGSKPRLMFYARPNHLRNLFYFGLQVIDQAVARGVIDPAQWEIHFVGAHIPPVALCDGTVPQRHEHLAWRDYASLAGSIDVALSLMATPHPSYPPLDLAASGAVVVTNRWGNKTDLSAYCGNIVCADLELEPMLTALREAIALARDAAERQRRFETRGLQRDWATAMAPVLQRFGRPGDAWA